MRAEADKMVNFMVAVFKIFNCDMVGLLIGDVLAGNRILWLGIFTGQERLGI